MTARHVSALASSLLHFTAWDGLETARGAGVPRSFRAALIRVHIAEGNISEALREFARYGEFLKLELGVEPTKRLRALVAVLGAVTPR
jgi:DNA-binding SARP family transcriptional activator